MKQLILGGARSGKSAYAESQALSLLEQKPECEVLSLISVATATSGDSETEARIEHHRQQRNDRWQLVEEPLDLSSVILQYNSSTDCLLIDCMTLWLTNALLNDCWSEVKNNFLSALQKSQASIFIVSNEVGSGVVPLGELSRQFVDESGWLHQELARYCDQVTLVVAGLPLALKQEV